MTAVQAEQIFATLHVLDQDVKHTNDNYAIGRDLHSGGGWGVSRKTKTERE